MQLDNDLKHQSKSAEWRIYFGDTVMTSGELFTPDILRIYLFYEEELKTV